MGFRRKSDVTAAAAAAARTAERDFRAEVEKALGGFNGQELSVTVPNGLPQERLEAIVAELNAVEWDAHIFTQPDGADAGDQILNIK